MTRHVLAIVIALTRGWLRVYTWHAPRHLAEARSAEIESDIWEMQHDAGLGPDWRRGWMATARLIEGMPDDIAWRFENLAPEQETIVRRLFALTAATVVVLSLWAVPSWLINGRREVAHCAAAAPHPQTTADLRLDVMRCAGAFFSSAR
ncbi:MAG TPA: hypothetical protein VMO26_29695 [Vicinamibacterales bacterium]|nr:hypothetical protein [Vicinamibacterales bacterium]